MPLTADDLRVRLKFPQDAWDQAWDVFAEADLESARTVMLTYADPDAVEQAEQDNDEQKLAALDEATLTYAVRLFGNPERKLQQRQGADYSTSWADSVKAASGLEEALAILDGAGLRGTSGKAFTIDTVRTSLFEEHADWCALNFDANYCDCGANLAGFPLFSEPA